MTSFLNLEAHGPYEYETILHRLFANWQRGGKLHICN